jgi:hypothetical protein
MMSAIGGRLRMGRGFSQEFEKLEREEERTLVHSSLALAFDHEQAWLSKDWAASGLFPYCRRVIPCSGFPPSGGFQLAHWTQEPKIGAE